MDRLQHCMLNAVAVFLPSLDRRTRVLAAVATAADRGVRVEHSRERNLFA